MKDPVFLSKSQLKTLAEDMSTGIVFSSEIIKDKDLLSIVFPGIEKINACLVYQYWSNCTHFRYKGFPIFPSYIVLHEKNFDDLKREMSRVAEKKMKKVQKTYVRVKPTKLTW